MYRSKEGMSFFSTLHCTPISRTSPIKYHEKIILNEINTLLKTLFIYLLARTNSCGFVTDVDVGRNDSPVKATLVERS